MVALLSHGKCSLDLALLIQELVLIFRLQKLPLHVPLPTNNTAEEFRKVDIKITTEHVSVFWRPRYDYEFLLYQRREKNRGVFSISN